MYHPNFLGSIIAELDPEIRGIAALVCCRARHIVGNVPCIPCNTWSEAMESEGRAKSDTVHLGVSKNRVPKMDGENNGTPY